MDSLIFIELLKIVIVVATLSIFLDLHRVFLPNVYSTIQEFLFEQNTSKTLKSTSIRIIIIVIISVLFFKYANFTTRQIVFGITIGCFLKVWPAIVQYKLLFPVNRNRLILFVEYLGFVILSGFSSYMTLKYLYPMIFLRKEFYIVSNDGISLLFSLISYIAPITLETLLSRCLYTSMYKNIESFREDLKIISWQMELDKYIVTQYEFEIQKACLKYEIKVQLLRTILLLEIINRGQWYNRFAENISCKYFPSYAIKRDITVGMGQIKISTAKEVLKRNPRRFIKKLVKPEYNIIVCAKYLKTIICQYNELRENGECFVDDIYQYIANQYLFGTEVSDNKNEMIYSAVLRSNCESL